jgi:hypothetical protein
MLENKGLAQDVLIRSQLTIADDNWRNTIPLQTMFFPKVKQKVASECEIFLSGYPSSSVEYFKDVRAIAKHLLDRLTRQFSR